MKPSTALKAALVATSLLGGYGMAAATPIHPELAEHTKHFEKKVYKIADNVYSAVGYGIANIVMIEGKDGIVLFDVGTQPGEAIEAMAEFRKITDKPVVAVVYSHFHPDHWGGVKGVVSEADVKAGKVKIIAHRTLMDNIIHQGGAIGPVLAVRSGYSFGLLLPESDREGMNDGIGPLVTPGTAGLIAPTDVFDDKLDITLAGVDFRFVFAPSEAPDEIVAYLPANRVLLSAEAEQGPSLPNIHTLRGTKFRDPKQWYKSLDILRSFKADYMVPTHGQPVYGQDKVEEVLRMTRDGIQFVHDQTLRYMNRGYTPDELANVVKFPPYLAGYKPYLREYYGTVKHAVRQIYNGYLGWFDGDPVNLDPVERHEASKRYVALMGGHDAVLKAAEDTLKGGDSQWAAELATHLIRVDPADTEARAIKAKAFRNLGYASMNSNWRNWYLMSAQELEGKLDPAKAVRDVIRYLASPDVASAWPLALILESMGPRLNPERSLGQHAGMAVEATDTGEKHAMEIRQAVLQFHAKAPEGTKLTISGPRTAILGLFTGTLDWKGFAAAGGKVRGGKPAEAEAFLAYFDPAFGPIALTVR